MRGLALTESKSHFIPQSGKTIDVPHASRDLYSIQKLFSSVLKHWRRAFITSTEYRQRFAPVGGLTMKTHPRKTQIPQSFFFGLLAAGLFLASPALTLGAPGDLDSTFGNSGKVTTEFHFAHATDVVVQADGKIVVCGTNEGVC